VDEKPVALEAYEALAERYAEMVDTKPHNAYYERPATLSLLPEVRGRRVLDAGCGPGVYAEWLSEHGAKVVALDVSPKMVRLARRRLAGRAEVYHADFRRQLGFDEGSFDIVLSALAMEYVEVWGAVFREFHRILRSQGYLVMSCGHPFADMLLHPDCDYFQVELVHWEWKGFGIPVRMPSYRRPLGAVLNPLIEAGFALDCVLEPLPTEQFREADPEEYDRLVRQPGFLCLRAVKR
jgi:SAM-dependent methyltransferase